MNKIILLVCCLSAILFISDVSPAQEHNILFITLDSTRRDHLGCYGYYRDTSPNIDNVAKESVVFNNAISLIPITSSAHVTLLTGLHPAHHKIFRNAYAVDDEFYMAAEMFKKQGYTTAAFVSSGFLGEEDGFNQGFDYFSDVIVGGSRPERPAAETIQDAMLWLEDNYSDKFFMWVHLFDPQLQYRPPEEFGNKFNPDYKKFIDHLDKAVLEHHDDNKELFEMPNFVIKSAIDAYDSEIAYADHYLGKLIELLKVKGIYENTIIVIVGSQGEMLYEKTRFFGHQRWLFQDTLIVPLIIKIPGVDHITVDQRITIQDVLPTLLELANMDIPENIDGISYANVLNGYQINIPEYSIAITNPNEWVPSWTSQDSSAVIPSRKLNFDEVFSKIAVIGDRFSYHFDKMHNTHGFYDLRLDPYEFNNLYGTGKFEDTLFEFHDIANKFYKDHKGDYLVENYKRGR